MGKGGSAGMKVKGHQGSIDFDGSVVTIKKLGAGSTSVPLATVQGASIVSAGVGMKAIRIAVAGGSIHGAQTFIGSHSQLIQDPFALTFKTWHKAKFEAFVAELIAAKNS